MIYCNVFHYSAISIFGRGPGLECRKLYIRGSGLEKVMVSDVIFLSEEILVLLVLRQLTNKIEGISKVLDFAEN